MLKKMVIFTVILGFVSLTNASLFEEHVTGGTLDENWTDFVAGDASWPVSSDQSHSPDYSRKGVNGTAAYNGSSIATDLTLPDSYTFSAWVYTPSSSSMERAALWFNADADTADADGNNEYELFLWHGDLLLGKRIGGAWNGLETKSGVSSVDSWRELKVEVTYDGNSTIIVTYLDGTLVTWDSGDTSYTDSSSPFHGGTIGLHRNNAAVAYFDDIVVVPEPATIGLLALGILGFIRKNS